MDEWILWFLEDIPFLAFLRVLRTNSREVPVSLLQPKLLSLMALQRLDNLHYGTVAEQARAHLQLKKEALTHSHPTINSLIFKTFASFEYHHTQMMMLLGLQRCCWT